MEGDKLLKANCDIKYHQILNQIAHKLTEAIKKESTVDTMMSGKKVAGTNISVNLIGNTIDKRAQHDVKALMQRLQNQGNFEALVKPKI